MIYLEDVGSGGTSKGYLGNFQNQTSAVLLGPLGVWVLMFVPSNPKFLS